MCRAEGLPNPHEVIKGFRDKALANDYIYADWEAAFRNWMRSALTVKAYPPWSDSLPKPPPVPPPPRPEDAGPQLTLDDPRLTEVRERLARATAHMDPARYDDIEKRESEP